MASPCWVLAFVRLGCVTGYSQPFIVHPGAPAVLRLNIPPGSPSPGAPLATQPSVAVFDSFNNLLWTGAGLAITASLIVPPTPPWPSMQLANGSVTAATPVQPVLTGHAVVAMDPSRPAVAVWTDLGVDVAGKGYVLLFSAAGAPPPASCASAGFDVRPGAAARLAMLQQPEGFRCAEPLKVQPIVAFSDAGGNLVPPPSTTAAAITVVLLSQGGIPSTGLLLSGNVVVNATNSSTTAIMAAATAGFAAPPQAAAEYTNLALVAGELTTDRGLRLRFYAAATGVATVDSRTFDSGGAARQLVISGIPAAGTAIAAGTPLWPVVSMVDLSGVQVEWWPVGTVRPSATLSVGAAATGVAPRVSGPTSTLLLLGVATFKGVQLVTACANATNAAMVSSGGKGFPLTFSLLGLQVTYTLTNKKNTMPLQIAAHTPAQIHTPFSCHEKSQPPIPLSPSSISIFSSSSPTPTLTPFLPCPHLLTNYIPKE